MTREATFNADEDLYVISDGDRYSCLGWDVMVDRMATMASLMGTEAPDLGERGSAEAYAAYRAMVREFAGSEGSRRAFLSPRLPKALIRCVRKAMRNGDTVRIWLGDRETGRSWMEEHDTVGMIGRSMGPMRVPILVPPGGDGGGAILMDCIVRIDVGGETGWAHPKFHVPAMEIRGREDLKFPWAIYVLDDPEHGEMEYSYHETYAKAAAMVAWLHGESHSPDNS